MTTPLPTLVFTAAPRGTLAKPVRVTHPIDQYAALFVGFDFGPALAAGVTAGDALIQCTAVIGADADPAARLLGAWALAPSLADGGADRMVVQLIGLMLPGVRYRLQCYADDSAGALGDVWGILACCAVPVAPVTHGVPFVDARGNPIVDANGNPLVS